MADLKVVNHGSIIILIGTSVEGNEWMDENVGDDETLTWGGGIVVEPRYIDDIVEGARQDGLEVE